MICVDCGKLKHIGDCEPHKCPRCGEPNPEHLDIDGCRDPDCPENGNE